MKRTALLKAIRKAARQSGESLDEVREGAQHSQFQVGQMRISVPRHSELSPGVTESIQKRLEAELGKGVVEVKTYTANVSRQGDWWFIEVPDVDGAVTQARRLDQVEDMARDVIALQADVDPGSFGVDVKVAAPDAVDNAIDRLKRAQAALEAASAELTDARRHAAEIAVHKEGLTVRDAGRLIGVSFQRVGQILQER